MPAAVTPAPTPATPWRKVRRVLVGRLLCPGLMLLTPSSFRATRMTPARGFPPYGGPLRHARRGVSGPAWPIRLFLGGDLPQAGATPEAMAGHRRDELPRHGVNIAVLADHDPVLGKAGGTGPGDLQDPT